MSTSVADPIGLRLGRSVGSSALLFGIVAALALVYTGTGGGVRDLLVNEMMVNLLLVLGFQVFIGTTGVLSFGHMAFVQIAAYATALFLIPAADKASSLPDVPFGLDSVAVSPWLGTLLGVAVAVLLGMVIGIPIARAGGLAATMITLAVLFVVDQVVKNWDELTRGAGGLSDIPRLSTSWWLWGAAFLGLVVANWFQETRSGRFAVATREDELAAGALGVRVPIERYVAWTLSIAMVALAGSLRAQTIGSVNPRQYTLDVGVLILAMLVVGGMRTPSGAVLGTVLITAGNELFRQLGDPARWDVERLPDLFLGAVLLLTMLLRPEGLLGDHDVSAWLRQRFHRVRLGGAPGGTAPGVRPLDAEDITVRFGGFIALDEASVRVEPGRVVGLIGPNGAGKTTLFNAITGLVEEEGGRISLGDDDLSNAPPFVRARDGLARTFQNLRLFANLPVRENVALAALVAERHRRHRPRVPVDQLLHDAGLLDVAHRKAGNLDYGNQRRLELARAAALAPEYLLLDEPTSGMSEDESLAMVDHVRSTAALVGAGVLVIDHDLAFISRICDHVVVLNEGRVLAEGTPAEVRANPQVAVAYLGTQA